MDQKEPGDGWTPWRVIGLVLGLIGMVGFGLVGLCGVFLAGLSNDSSFHVLVVMAFVLCSLCLWLVVAMFRRARRRRSNGA